ncbi:hypothetical protein [Paraflavitalea sp. CAU 1676]|uniref:hypothetical protein n=1 Tax=Paraflavitalea sp. CAU 1676 TaxID=3032598 RepID=UPI0023DC16AD|nr:hypothetical protein [Paraflavitalea sp. CAU 1676]MDF2190492.1 hypothetical protein [Paraflavitalea sp. CAU 1676]
MRISESPTLWVIIKATTYSKQSSCNFILVHLSIGYCNHLKSILKRVSEEDTPNFYCLNIWDAPFGWFVHTAQDEIEAFLSDEGVNWSFISFDSHNEIRDFTKPNQKFMFKEQYISFFKGGTAMFQAYTDETNDDYHSVEFPLHEMISLLEKT